MVQTKHSIKVRLPTPSPAQPSTPKRAPGAERAEPLRTTDSPKASTKHSNAAEPRATQVAGDSKPIYYIPHPDEYAGKGALFPHTTYVITKGEEVGLFAAWYVPYATHYRASDTLYPGTTRPFEFKIFPPRKAASSIFCKASPPSKQPSTCTSMRTIRVLLSPSPFLGVPSTLPLISFLKTSPIQTASGIPIRHRGTKRIARVGFLRTLMKKSKFAPVVHQFGRTCSMGSADLTHQNPRFNNVKLRLERRPYFSSF